MVWDVTFIYGVEKYNPIDGQWNKVDKVFFNNFVIGRIKKDLEETFGVDDNESDEIIKII